MENKEQLIKQLTDLLDKGGDYNEIITLTTKLANDDNSVRFSVDAGLINRLGRELVAKQETAVAELIKNAFDADALNTQLMFIDAEQKGGSLLIRDNGLGMTKEQLINGFMRIATADKVENPYSEKFNRKKAGRKGIGRFSAQRLGTTLHVITQTKDCDTALQVIIDWNKFSGQIDIGAVSNEIKAIPKNREEGTDLVIYNLREAWTDAAIKRVYRFVIDLQQPFPLTASSSNVDSGFKTTIYKKTKNGEPHIIADDEEMIKKYSIATITGYTDIGGKAFYSIVSNKFNLSDYDISLTKEKKDYNSLKEIHFRTDYYIYNDEFIPRMMKNSIRKLAREKGGIRVYRNGFRVMPYGQPPNDWVGLDKQSGNKDYPTGNANFFGFVEITDTDDKKFIEVSSREGFIENEPFQELQDFIYKSLIAGARRVWSARKPKGKEESTKYNSATLKNSKEFSEKVSNLKESAKFQNEQEEEHFEQQTEDIISDFETLKDEHDKSIEEINMLRVLAALGLTIGEFTHEIRQPIEGLNANVDILNKIISDTKSRNALDRIKSIVDTFKNYTYFFDKSISQNVSRELKKLDIRNVITDFSKIIEYDVLRLKINYSLNIKGFDLHTCPMHPSEWSSILYNLYSNSKKAIIRANVEGKIKISAKRFEDKFIIIDFMDNGDGIPEENKNKIFNEFFTTSPPVGYNSSEEKELVGSGLGLKIVKDIISTYNGKIYVTENETDFSTTIRIEISQSKNI